MSTWTRSAWGADDYEMWQAQLAGARSRLTARAARPGPDRPPRPRARHPLTAVHGPLDGLHPATRGLSTWPPRGHTRATCVATLRCLASRATPATARAEHHQGRWENDHDRLRTARIAGLARHRRVAATTTSSAATGSTPKKGHYFENVSPVNGEPFSEIARGTDEDIEAALDAAHAAAPAWGTTSPRRALAHPQPDRRPHRGEPRGARRRRDVGQRQGRPRDARRRPAARRRPLPLLRRRPSRTGGLDQRDRRGHRRLPLPRAARRRRPDHPVELPDPHGRVEARAGARRRQLRRAQARRADPVVDPQGRRARSATCCPPGVLNVVNGFGVEAGKPLASSARGSPRSPSPARRRPAG